MEQELKAYAKIFEEHFGVRFDGANNDYFEIEIYNENSYFIAMNFKVVPEKPKITINFKQNKDTEDILKALGDISISRISNALNLQKDIKGFEENSFYVIKTKGEKNWCLDVARLDVNEFMDAILKAGKKKMLGE